MYSLIDIVVAALVSHAPISALKDFANPNTGGVVREMSSTGVCECTKKRRDVPKYFVCIGRV